MLRKPGWVSVAGRCAPDGSGGREGGAGGVVTEFDVIGVRHVLVPVVVPVVPCVGICTLW